MTKDPFPPMEGYTACFRCGRYFTEGKCPCRSTEPVAQCPRCLGGMWWPGAGSRMTPERDLEVCGWCGSDEADRDALGLAPIPPSDWPVTALSVHSHLYGEKEWMMITPLDAEMMLLVDEQRQGE